DQRGLDLLADVVGGRDVDAGLGALMAALPLCRERPEGTDRWRIACAMVATRFFVNALLKAWAAGNLSALGDPRGEPILAKLAKSGRADVRGSVEEVRAILNGREPTE